MDTETKTCSKCGEVKPVDEFYTGRAVCKTCVCAKAKAWRDANPDRAYENRKAWQLSNKEKTNKMNRDWYARNREKKKAATNAWRKANPEKIRSNRKRLYDANPEKAREKERLWRKANPEKYLQIQAKWRGLNRDKLREIYKARREQLAQSYVKQIITDGTSIKEVPQSLIELKRVQLMITRKLKELKK